MLKERRGFSISGFGALLLVIGAVVWLGLEFAKARSQPSPMLAGAAVVTAIAVILLLRGMVVIDPNEAFVCQFFGTYVGTIRSSGLRWTVPFFSRTKISLRARNFESQKLKVNDSDGNPIEIASVVVWRVSDTAEAMFNVEDYANYVRVQSEAAVRDMAAKFPYDGHDEDQIALRSHAHEVAERLQKELNARLTQAGIEVVDARITHLAYAPEIAQAMLQRQQASAIIAARTRIVEGAVSMVEMALARLAERKTVELDEERKAAMVCNLLVVLCGERGAQPVINSGTLYSG